MLVYNRVMPVDEIVAKVDAVDADAVRRVARRLLESKPTLTAIGPLSRLESYDTIRGRLTG
jgi:predicted Zn-dependent peptidase